MIDSKVPAKKFVPKVVQDVVNRKMKIAQLSTKKLWVVSPDKHYESESEA
jgi:hypothetical protein